MDIQQLLDWAFQRHLNPLSWYIRPLFLIGLCYFAYKRSWKGIIFTFLIMTSSMVWFPPPTRINEQMHQVLDFEKKILGSPTSALLTLGLMFFSLYLILSAFWKRSFKLAWILLNVLILGKLILSLVFTGESGWGTFGVTVFGLVIANLIGLLIFIWKRKKALDSDQMG